MGPMRRFTIQQMKYLVFLIYTETQGVSEGMNIKGKGNGERTYGWIGPG